MAVDYKDYYKILGVSEKADQKEIRQSYRKLARQYHPDVNPNDRTAEDRFKEINEANEVLSDPEKRKKYDEMRDYYQQYGRWPGEAAPTGARPGTDGGGFAGGNYQYRTMSEEDLSDLFGSQSPYSDFFETFFHSGSGTGGFSTRARQRQTTGEDVEATVEVTLQEAYQGATRTFELSEPDGKTRRLEVKIPAGVQDGARIRIAGQGGQGSAGRGDIYLRVNILPDDTFTRDGTTLRTSVEVPLTVAMLGGDASVTTPDGRRLLLRIPAGTQNGRTFRLRGQGMPHLNQTDNRGDLYAEARIQLPTHLTDEQRRLFEAFARSIGYTGNGETK
jgi:curved DNA-binding protein